MPITKSAKKSFRQSRKKAIFNRRSREKAKRLIRTFKKSPTKKKLAEVYSALDKATKRNIFHKNKSARLKSRLTRLLKEKQKKTPKAPSKKKAPQKKKTSARMTKKRK